MMKTNCILLLLLLAAVACQAHPGSLRFLQGEEGCNCSTDHPCTECEQCDCDSDAECQGDLVCYQRDAGDPIPGCSGIGTAGRTDFCAAAGTTTPAPAPAPTAAPDDDCILGDIGDTICFSGDTSVDVWNKGPVSMEQLKVGDRILTGTNQYETVYSFAHYQPSREATFLKIQTNGKGQDLDISKEHLIFLNGKAIRASDLAMGDQLMPDATITKITSVQKKGIYAPLTASGTLIVNDGIKVSAYAALLPESDEYARFQDGTVFMSQQDAVHLFLTPYRMVCRAANAVGLASVCDTYNADSGMPSYIEYGIRILRWVDGQCLALQILLLFTVYPIFGGLLGVEKALCGGGMSVIVLMLCGMAVWKSKSAHKRV